MIAVGREVSGNQQHSIGGAGAGASASAAAAASAAIAASISAASKLDALQQGELQLARHRSERAKAGRISAASMSALDLPANAGGATLKRTRNQPAPSAAAAAAEAAADADAFGGDSDDDSDDDVSKLPPEEQARLLAGGAGTNNAKDARRLKRLLRNRVSAQQARERKKMHLTNLQDQLTAQQMVIADLEAKLKQAESQNNVLRRIIRSMQPEGPADAKSPADH